MKHKLLICIIGSAALLSVLPTGVLWARNGFSLHVPPEIEDDTIYYYARMETVANGHPFIGNPYYKEHAGEIASAFFGADWIAAAPLFIGLPLFAAILFNLVLWSAICAALLYWLALVFGMRGWWALGATAVTFGASFWLLQRPVAMQIVFPVFILFLISYLLWLQDTRSKLHISFLILTTTLTFYIYTYLWQIAAVVIILSHLLFFLRERKKYFPLLYIDAISLVLISPILFYTYLQLHHVWYWETMTRIGLVETHTFGFAAIESLLIIVFCYAGLWAAGMKGEDGSVKIFFTLTAVAFIGTTFSNVITSKDLEVAVHIARFVYIWATFIAVYALFLFARTRNNTNTKLFARYAAAFKIALIVLMAWLLYGSVASWISLTPELLKSQRYAAPLAWLQKNTPAGSIVFADDALSYYIPALTKDYVLFQPDGGLYLMPDKEIQDRYLISRIFNDLSLADIENDFRLYAGVGNAVHAYKTQNRRVKLCEIFIHTNCGLATTALGYTGADYFQQIFLRYKQVEEKPEESLRTFGVNYIVKDSQSDSKFEPQKLPNVRLEAALDGFEIYSIH